MECQGMRALLGAFLLSIFAGIATAAPPASVSNTGAETNSTRTTSADPLYAVQFRLFINDSLYAAPSAVVRSGEESLIEYAGESAYKLRFRITKASAPRIKNTEPDDFNLKATVYLPAQFETDAGLKEAIAPSFDLRIGQQVEMATSIDQLFLSDGATRAAAKKVRIEAIVTKSDLSMNELMERSANCKKVVSESESASSDLRILGPGAVVDSRQCCSSGNLTCCWGRQCCSDGKTGNGCCI